MRTLAAFLLIAACLGGQTYQANWESLDRRPNPAWFTEDKFGIFIHWGVYSVPAYAKVGQYAEWYWNNMTKGRDSVPDKSGNAALTWAFHQKNYGTGFDYARFAPMFKAELFDPDHWADVFQRSGAKYIVLTSKHHEGFALWPSAHASKVWGRPWNSVEVGPKRDLLGDLTNSVRAKGLRMGFYYSLYEWFNPLWLADRKRYAMEHVHPQFKDVVTRYKPSIIFGDGEWDMPSDDWKTPELLAWLFNESPARQEVVVNDRWGKDTRHKHGGYFTTEYTAGLQGANHPWEEDRGMGFSFGYNRAEDLKDYRTARELILMLVDLVSRGGNLLLDIGPTGDGRIPVIMEERLTQMGEWLRVNGEAIYGTKQWRKTRQWSDGKIPELKQGQFMVRYEVTDWLKKATPDAAVIEVFFTCKGDSVYAITPGWPGRRLVLKDIRAKQARLLGHAQPLKLERAEGGVAVVLPELPADAATAQYAYAIKLEGVQ